MGRNIVIVVMLACLEMAWISDCIACWWQAAGKQKRGGIMKTK
jgi:hypothetical protein